MSFSAAEKIADAVLFEGYMLYPYRPSALKNRQRWNFGTLYPRGFAEAQCPHESFSLHAEILLNAGPGTHFDLRLRFLALLSQTSSSHDYSGLDSWDVGLVRSHTLENIALAAITEPTQRRLNLTALSADEQARAPEFFVVQPSFARLHLQATQLGEALFRIAVTLANESPVDDEPKAEIARRAAQAAAFTSAHLLLHSEEGRFVSLLDPPDELAEAAAACRNQGVFPVLIGRESDRSTVLCSPIILYDYPQIAPESPGDFFDGTEMDEILALRVLTLTDAEKREMRASDPYAQTILERVESLTGERLLKIHGTNRRATAAPVMEAHAEPWNPFDEEPVLESVRAFGVEVRKGDRVRLWPQKQADMMDRVMEGRIAIIEAIEQDLEGNVQLAVVLEDDPGKDMGLLRQAGHRFFFSPEEIEPLHRASQDPEAS
jgi:hypothetical protein